MTTDGQTVYINGCMCTLRYRPEQLPIVVDMDKISEEMVLECAPPAWNLSDPRFKEAPVDCLDGEEDDIEFKD